MAEVVVANSADQFVVGVPPNNGAFFDGTRYWIFYTESNVLKCQYGTSLSSMASTNTDGVGNVSDVDDSGKAYSIVFGQIGATWYAWAVVDTELGSSSGAHIDWWRWELTSSGLGAPTNVSSTITDKTAGACIAHGYGGATVSNLYGGAQAWDTNRAHRTIAADMTGESGVGGVTFYDSANVGYLETGKLIRLSDGYLSFGFTTDASGNAYGMEKTSATLSMSGTFIDITGTGAGSFADASYATNTSHMGQADDCQLDDGTYYVAYIDDADATNGDYGHIILRQRGNTMASTWSTVSTDVIGSSAEAWHLAVSTDGTDIWIFYCKDKSGTRDTSIYYRKYNVSGDSFGAETKLADLQAGHTFERMFTQWRAANDEIVVAWSEKSGSSYDLVAESIDISGSATLSVQDIGQTQSIGSASLTSHGSIAVSGLAQSQTISDSAIIQHSLLSADSIVQNQSISDPVITQAHVLTVNSVLQSQSLDEPLILQHHQLAVSDIAQSQGVSNISLLVGGSLAVSSVLQSQLISSPALTQHNALAVQDLTQSQTVDPVLLQVLGQIAPASITQSQLLNASQLTPHHALVVDKLSQSQVLDNTTLDATTALTVADIGQSQLIDNSVLSANHVLSVDSLTQQQLIDLVQFGGTVIGFLKGKVVICSLVDGEPTISHLLDGNITIN